MWAWKELPVTEDAPVVIVWSERTPQPSLYEILGVDATASRQEITQRYRTLARTTHPDARPSDPERANAEMIQLNLAFETLCDPERRAAYDRRYGTKGC